MRGGLWPVGLVVALSCAGRQEEPATLGQARELLRNAGTPSGDVVLRCEPPDAEVYLDGVIQGICTDFRGSPRGLRVGKGLHQIEVRKQGYWPYTTYFEPHGARAALDVRLQTMGTGTPEGGAP
ncbi:PEGA domain-containing protein [Hyalangium rubrum]|uniref:PEGA domain-containing protein n=1 Tax=Hyalangium rubrum TaxID=3103134 RepID=A0ABU5HEJ8_9BACT|nr:PEGA domain-containing protein [Hyalangium sp. s54d21]MDY7231549.1 PEGA domain-containing protein [Hyalangium sp. s54d21]